MFTYANLSMVAGYLQDLAEERASDIINRLIPHRYVDGKNHGKRSGKGFEWDLRVDADGKEDLLDELRGRQYEYVIRRSLALSESWDRRGSASVYIVARDIAGESHQDFLFSGTAALKAVRFQSFLRDCRRLARPIAELAPEIEAEQQAAETFMRAEHERLLCDFDPKVSRLRKKRAGRHLLRARDTAWQPRRSVVRRGHARLGQHADRGPGRSRPGRDRDQHLSTVGGAISGTVTYTDPGPSQFGSVPPTIEVYNGFNSLVKARDLSSFGFRSPITYTVDGLPSGTYYVKVASSAGEGDRVQSPSGLFVDQLYKNVTCVAQDCLPNSGTPVAVTAGAVTANIDVALVTGGSSGSGGRLSRRHLCRCLRFARGPAAAAHGLAGIRSVAGHLRRDGAALGHLLPPGPRQRRRRARARAVSRHSL